MNRVWERLMLGVGHRCVISGEDRGTGLLPAAPGMWGLEDEYLDAARVSKPLAHLSGRPDHDLPLLGFGSAVAGSICASIHPKSRGCAARRNR
jgi:hypothetical protein